MMRAVPVFLCFTCLRGCGSLIRDRPRAWGVVRSKQQENAPCCTRCWHNNITAQTYPTVVFQPNFLSLLDQRMHAVTLGQFPGRMQAKTKKLTNQHLVLARSISEIGSSAGHLLYRRCMYCAAERKHVVRKARGCHSALQVAVVGQESVHLGHIAISYSRS